MVRARFGILDAAAEVPDRVALVAAGVTYTFAAIAERVRHLAAWLDRHASASGAPARVALVPRLDVESFCVIHALVELGMTGIFVHPRLTSDERAALVADAAPDLVIEDCAAALREAEALAPLTPVRASIDDERCLAILFTSGTTGRPKGAMLSRRAFLAAAEASAENLGWQSDDRWLLCMPLAHVGGLSIVIRALSARRTVVIAEGDRFDPDGLLRVMARDRVTIASLVPTMLTRILERAPRPLPPHVRVIMLGGAASSAALLANARALGIPALTTYGLTEACSQVTTQRYGTAPGIEQGSGPPVAGMAVRIVDGRVEVSGRSLMSGYYGRPAAESPIGADGWLRTEDFGRIDDEGRLHLLGRKQELLVTGGENVYPLEVERAIEAMPGVVACCVFGVPDETWGELVGVAIVLAPEAPSIDELAARCETSLAKHKRPRLLAVVEGLVATPAGKLDRAATAAMATPRLIAFGRGGQRSP